jgi:hypothetical protein
LKPSPEKHKCGALIDRAVNPLVIPPTWNKSEYRELILPVWKRAARELETAENIYVIGYSLPPSDGFFKYLYGLGTLGTRVIRRFWVFNPDEKVDFRFKELLGTGVAERYKFFLKGFREAAEIIRQSGLF